MNKIFLKAILAFTIFISSLMILPLSIHAEEASETKEEINDDSFDAYIATGTGLVAVSGVGAAIITYNNRKPKNVPKNEDE